MNDNEIKKALECCKRGAVNRCKGCPYRENIMCALNLRADALDLLNRKDAEIEEKDTEIDILIRKKERLKDEIFELNPKIDRLKNDLIFREKQIENLLEEMAGGDNE